ncbi:MAG: phenylalanine--tRNA ligase subunit beta [Chlamydiae bacterium RIFCSPLOWO2_12_FULL_49_12]|nr:MAG: phenylalanine--tRNA ligase subunit beta [Chlamydiae bacterium RIFCSPLOWO2_12_FULL_49_12]
MFFMKVPLSALKELLPLTLSENKVAEVLTLAGLEVEGIEHAFKETVFDISLTPNLGHCMSFLGIARELGALLDLPVKFPKLPLQEEGRPIEELIDVEVYDNENCPLYTCRILEGITVGPSPSSLAELCEKCGLRSVNNVVDVTNFVMLLLGQPLHAFDLDKIDKKKILVSSKTPYRQLFTLDGKERDLPEEALLICDSRQPLAIAGIMGGEKSSVSSATTRILIESAAFHPAAIRKVSKWLSLRTDSSIRFEKGIDPQAVPQALDLAAAHIQQLAGGKIAQGKIVRASREFLPKELSVRKERINSLLGTTLSLGELLSLFKRLNFDLLQEEDEVIRLRIPTYRNDIREEIDLIEEIARLFGFNHIPLRAERYLTSRIPHDAAYLLEKNARDTLLKEGLQEWITCDLISPSVTELLHEHKERLIPVLKPASMDQSILRPSLLPSLLLCVKHNFDHQNSDLYSFEIGRVHFKEKEDYKEESAVGIVLAGKSSPYHFDPKPREFDFLDLKGIVENLLEGLLFDDPCFKTSHLPSFHPKRQASIHVGTERAGVIGQLHPALLQHMEIEKPVYFAELSLFALSLCFKKRVFFSGLPLFPSSQRDWTLTVSDRVTIRELTQAILSASSPLLERITLLDLYKSDQIGKDRKNVTFRFIYRDPDKTLSMDRVEQEHAAITGKVAEQFII